jgi:hypothetical protein
VAGLLNDFVLFDAETRRRLDDEEQVQQIADDGADRRMALLEQIHLF